MIYMDITLSPNDYNARKGVMKILLNGLPSLLINFKTSNKQCLVFFFCFLKRSLGAKFSQASCENKQL